MPFWLMYYATQGVSTSWQRSRESSRVPSMAAHRGTDGLWREIPLQSYIVSMTCLTTTVSTSLFYNSSGLDLWHCAGWFRAQLSKQPIHHQQPQSLVLVTQPLHTPDVAASSLEISTKLMFPGNGCILVPSDQQVPALFLVSGRSIPLADCLPNSRSKILLKMDKPKIANMHLYESHFNLLQSTRRN